jgi:YVTN family beta-propeller protein
LRRQGQVFVIDTNTHKVIAQLDVDQNPVALLLNPAETRLYITNNMGNTVTVIHTDTFEKVTICVGKAPVASVLNSAGTRLYVVNQMSHNIFVIDTATHQVIAVIDVEGKPEAIAIREGSVIGDEVRFRSLSCNTIV